MNNFIGLITMILLLGKTDVKPAYKLSTADRSHYLMRVTNFEWHLLSFENQTFYGDFESLDHTVFEMLKGKDGTCEIILEQLSVPSMPKEGIVSSNIGILNIQELKEYKNWKQWHKKAGCLKLIRQLLVTKETSAKDSTAITPIN